LAIGNLDHSHPFGHGIIGYTPHYIPFSCANNDKGFCTFFLINPLLLINPNGELLQMITLITTMINIIAAFLIAARVIYFQRYIIQAVGSERNNQYTTVIVICIESSALIVLFSILLIVLVLNGSPESFIFMQSLVHINVRVHNLLLSCKNRESYVCLKY
jgi:hypothetical protein